MVALENSQIAWLLSWPRILQSTVRVLDDFYFFCISFLIGLRLSLDLVQRGKCRTSYLETEAFLKICEKKIPHSFFDIFHLVEAQTIYPEKIEGGEVTEIKCFRLRAIK